MEISLLPQRIEPFVHSTQKANSVMSARDYELLKEKSAAAGLSANAWLMAQLEINRPVLHREDENSATAETKTAQFLFYAVLASCQVL